ncbi:MAG: acyltransferase [Deltaproteobacteria bacterium]|nr:acyltransferase [Deltaproteobacteria bacterium]
MKQIYKLTYLEKNYGTNILPLSIVENEDLPGTNPMEVLGFYKKETSLLRIKESLFKTVEHYNLFSSRLIMIDHNKFALQYCTNGFEYNALPFINTTFDNINIDDIKKMIVNVKTLPGEPLFAVTIIPIKDGVFGGISCSHAIADGFSLLLFLFSWGCIKDGNSFPFPSTQRLFKGNPISFDKIDKVFIPPLSELSNEIQNRVKYVNNIKLYSKKEYFSDEFLNEIKNKAKLENAKNIISDNQIIISFLLKKYHDHIMPDTDRIRLRNPINIRDVHPDIDSSYIGNAYFDSITEFTKDEINKMSIYEIAYRLKESIINTRNENFIKEISYLSKYGIEFKTDIFKTYPTYNIDTDIVSSNLTHVGDLESLGLGSDIGSILYMSSPAQTGFSMLKEKGGRIFAQITSRYPFM